MTDLDKIEAIMVYLGLECTKRKHARGTTLTAAGRKFYADGDGVIYKIEEA